MLNNVELIIAKVRQCKLVEGNNPQNTDDIVCDLVVLEALTSEPSLHLQESITLHHECLRKLIALAQLQQA